MSGRLRTGWTLAVLACLAAAAAATRASTAAAPLEDFQGVFEETVIQIEFVKVGARVQWMYLGDVPDNRHYMSAGERFVAGQRLTYSVFGKRDYRVSFWSGEHQLEVKTSEPLDQPAGKGQRLTYEDGTIVEIIV